MQNFLSNTVFPVLYSIVLAIGVFVFSHKLVTAVGVTLFAIVLGGIIGRVY